MNEKLLRKVKKHILEEPRRFAMGTWHSRGIPDTPLGATMDYSAGNQHEGKQKFPSCGTICCIGGWARVFDPQDKHNFDSWAGNLIDAESWPKQFRSRYAKARTPLGRAKIAAERIDHFIKTKGAE